MRRSRLLAVLVAAAVAAQAASAAVPPWRRADNARALAIGLRASDAGPGWRNATARRSPYTIDMGSVMSSQAVGACLSSETPTKAETDLIITGASMSALSRSVDTLTSFVMLFKTPTLARAQMPKPDVASEIRSCIGHELRSSLGAAGASAVTIVPRRLDTGSPFQAAYRITARLAVGPLYLDLVMQGDGRGIVETIFLSLAVPPAAALEHRVTGISALRLARDAA